MRLRALLLAAAVTASLGTAAGGTAQAATCTRPHARAHVYHNDTGSTFERVYVEANQCAEPVRADWHCHQHGGFPRAPSWGWMMATESVVQVHRISAANCTGPLSFPPFYAGSYGFAYHRNVRHWKWIYIQVGHLSHKASA